MSQDVGQVGELVLSENGEVKRFAVVDMEEYQRLSTVSALLQEAEVLRESVDSIKEAILRLAAGEEGRNIWLSLPEPIAILHHEGDEWTPWNPKQTNTVYAIHAIRFADGSIFDVVNGWRQKKVE